MGGCYTEWKYYQKINDTYTKTEANTNNHVKYVPPQSLVYNLQSTESLSERAEHIACSNYMDGKSQQQELLDTEDGCLTQRPTKMAPQGTTCQEP